MQVRGLRWKPSGAISLWRYTTNQRNFPGWHLSADAESCNSLTDLLAHLSSSDAGESYELSIAPPSREVLSVPNNGSSSLIAPSFWRLKLSRDSSSWSFSMVENAALLELGMVWLEPLMGGVSAMKSGQGDYSIGPDAAEERLWFWWRIRNSK